MSTCAALGPAGECPLPDLIAIIDEDFPDVSISRVEAGECAAGCMSPGRHRLLQFAQSLAIVNNGVVDVLFGGPGMPGVRELPPLADCRSISYVEGLVRFELLGMDRTITRAADATFAPGCWGAAQAPFDCWFLGIPKGTASRALVCDRVLLDGVPPGDYVLRVTVDPGDRIPERDEMNNVRDFPFELVDPDPLGECTLPRPDLDAPEPRECGWTPSLTAVCDPGESILLGCPGCAGDPVLRVCPGPEVCVSGDAIAFNDDRVPGQEDYCPEVLFDCPQAGRYATFTSPLEPGEPVACSVTVSSADAGSSL